MHLHSQLLSDVGLSFREADPGSLAIADNIPGATDNGLNCSYLHDDLTRVQEANCGSAYDESFSWDPFGNHNSSGTPTGLVTTFSFSNNQITGGGLYDSDGNQVSDPGSGKTNAFDANGCPTEIEGVTVVCDALGRVVEAGSNQFVYSPGGSRIAVMSGTTLQRALWEHRVAMQSGV